MTAKTPNTPDKKLALHVDGQDREAFMSYGLQDQLLRLVRDTNEIGLVYADPDTRNAVIEQVLADRTPSGKIIQKKNFDDYDISTEEVEKLLAWVIDHVTAFFIRVIGVLSSKVQTENTILTEAAIPSTPTQDGSAS